MQRGGLLDHPSAVIFGIESVEYRQNQGFFAIGKNINLFASTSPW